MPGTEQMNRVARVVVKTAYCFAELFNGQALRQRRVVKNIDKQHRGTGKLLVFSSAASDWPFFAEFGSQLFFVQSCKLLPLRLKGIHDRSIYSRGLSHRAHVASV